MDDAMTPKDELLPCPCCGGVPRLANVEMAGCSYVVCTDCRLQTDDGSRDRVVKAWNTRAATQPSMAAAIEWAVEKWRDEVKNRPLHNVHRRTLDDTWRTVMRHFGGDPDALVGPDHDTLRAIAGDKP